MAQFPEDDTSSLERAREHLYNPAAGLHSSHRPSLTPTDTRELPHEWRDETPQSAVPHIGKRHVHLASVFLGAAFLFFLVSLGIAGYVFYVGGNSVSVDKVTVDVQGPTTIAGGDVVRGRVMVLCGENPDDYNMHLIATMQDMGLEPADLDDILVIPSRFDIDGAMDWLRDEVEAFGDVVAFDKPLELHW